jgi:hypothetical protein
MRRGGRGVSASGRRWFELRGERRWGCGMTGSKESGKSGQAIENFGKGERGAVGAEDVNHEESQQKRKEYRGEGDGKRAHSKHWLETSTARAGAKGWRWTGRERKGKG